MAVAENMRKKQQRGGGYLGHIWQALRSSLSAGLLLAFYPAASSKFENIVVGYAGADLHQRRYCVSGRSLLLIADVD